MGVCVLESVHFCRTSRELQETVVVLMKQSLQLKVLLEQPEVYSASHTVDSTF